MPAKKLLPTPHIKKITEWLTIKQPDIDRDKLFIAQTLQTPELDYEKWLGMRTCLRVLISFIGGDACLAIAQGEEHGWRRFHEALVYRYYSERIAASYPGKPARNGANDVALILADGMVLQHEGMTSFAGNRLLQGLTVPKTFFESIFDNAPLAAFMVHLYARYTGATLPAKPLNLGIYTGILQHWHDPEPLALALHEACECHVKRSRDNNYDGEFWRYPDKYFPAELLAVKFVRARLGLETPPIDHPLLQTIFANPPLPLPPIADPLLLEIAARYQQDFGQAIDAP